MAIHLRRKALSDGRVSLYLDIYDSGKRKSEFLSLYLVGDKGTDKSTLLIAQKVKSERQLALDSLRYDFNAPKDNIDFYAFAERHISTKNTGNQVIFRKFLMHFKKFSGTHLLFKHITPEFIQRFKTYLLEQPLRPATQSLYLVKLKTLLNEAVRQRLLNTSPASGITIKVPESLPKYLTLEEIRLLSTVPCSNEQVKHAFLFSCATGLRFSDVERLTWADVADSHVRLIQKKSGQIVSIPLNGAGRLILEKQLRTTDNPSNKGKVFTFPDYRTINRTIKRWTSDAGISKRVTFHVARHSFATLLISSGCDIYVVSSLLGHRKLQTTQIYARMTDRKREEALKFLPDIV